MDVRKIEEIERYGVKGVREKGELRRRYLRQRVDRHHPENRHHTDIQLTHN